MGPPLPASLSCQEDEGCREGEVLKEALQRTGQGWLLVLIPSRFRGSGKLERLWMWAGFFSIFQNASSAYIVFTINKSIELTLKGACSKVVFVEGWRLLLGCHRPPWGSLSQRQWGQGWHCPTWGSGAGAVAPQNLVLVTSADQNSAPGL